MMAWTTEIEAPTSQQLTEAERAYDEIMKEVYGEDYKTRRKARSTQTETADDGETTDDEVDSVVNQLEL